MYSDGVDDIFCVLKLFIETCGQIRRSKKVGEVNYITNIDLSINVKQKQKTFNLLITKNMRIPLSLKNTIHFHPKIFQVPQYFNIYVLLYTCSVALPYQ